jgi:DegV family protein with EDD domain
MIDLEKEIPMPILITDSTSDFSLEQAKQLNIQMLPLGVTFGDTIYKDKIDITNDQFYAMLANAKNIPTTNLINPTEYLDIFNEFPDEEIIVIPIAKELSGTYQSANIAKEILHRDDIYILDTKTVTCGLALLVNAAVSYRDAGLTTKNILSKLEEDIKKIQIIAVFDTLKYLIKGGRLTKIQGTIGTALNLKPILSISNGELIPVGKCRGNKAAYKEILRMVKEDYPIDSSRELYYGHANSIEMLNNFKALSPYQGLDFEIGCVVGTHAGPGAVAIAYFTQ